MDNDHHFTLEYLLRIWISPKPVKYIFSFWGIIDLLSFLPTYLRIFIFGYHYLIVIRIFRLLRVFRILKLARFNNESKLLVNALKSSLHKLGVFLVAVITIVVFMGTIMYVVEGGEQGFTSIPQSIYWAVVTRYYRWVWRHGPPHSIREIYFFHSYDNRIRNYCCAHRDYYSRNGQFGQEKKGV